MGTRATVTARMSDGTYSSIYVGHDGYPSHLGDVLLKHYSTMERIEALMDLGDLSGIGPKLSKDDPTPGKYVCSAYGRDGGETGTEAGKGCSALAAINDGGYGEQEYNYAWNGVIWILDSKPLTQEICDKDD